MFTSRIHTGSCCLLEQIWVGIEESPDHQCGDRCKDYGSPCCKISVVAGPLQKLKKACHQMECKLFGSGSACWQIPAMFASPHTPKKVFRFKSFRFSSAKAVPALPLQILRCSSSMVMSSQPACSAELFASNSAVRGSVRRGRPSPPGESTR